jgi:hypothetical protein
VCSITRFHLDSETICRPAVRLREGEGILELAGASSNNFQAFHSLVDKELKIEKERRHVAALTKVTKATKNRAGKMVPVVADERTAAMLNGPPGYLDELPA